MLLTPRPVNMVASMSKLKRTLSWQVFMLYGLGNILGAGIYVLVGEVAAEAGNGMIWSFIIAGIVAGFTALSYSAMAKQYPVSAGAAVYTQRSFGRKNLSLFIGLVLAFSGVVSAGVLLNGFANYFSELLDIPKFIYICAALAAIAAVTIKGIRESARLAVIITVLEAGGLLLVAGASMLSPGFGENVAEVAKGSLDASPLPILLGSFLAFYAFIGFEDMVNVAEEVREPRTSVKKGMLGALAIASVFYVLIAITSLAVVPADHLGQADAPLSLVFEVSTGSDFPIITLIGLFAIINGVLAQIIMSSRVLYGLARENMISGWFGQINPKTKTPIRASLVVAVLILIGALSLPLVTLASLTSFALLAIFSIVHIAAWRLRKKLSLNRAVPAVGLLLNIGVMLMQITQWL
jgi:amino acid transporter